MTPNEYNHRWLRPASARLPSSPRLGKITPSGAAVADGIELLASECDRKLVSKDAGAAGELPASSGIVVLDCKVTPEPEAEGIARDLVRVIQQARRDKGLEVSDRIRLTIDAPENVKAASRI